MNIDTNRTCHAVCMCTFEAPSKEVLETPEFNADLARYWRGVTACSRYAYEAVLDEFYVNHGGQLPGLDTKTIDLFAYDLAGDDVIDRALGKDVYRTLRRYFVRAYRRRQRPVTGDRLMMSLLLHHARSIRTCRTTGCCANRRPVEA